MSITQMKYFYLLMVIINSVLCKKVQKKKMLKLNNDVLDKSEVVLKFPLYSLQIPPLVATRRKVSSKVNPIPVSCSSNNVTQSFNQLRKVIKCEPRDTVVAVSSEDGQTIIPNVVVVKRCGGVCSTGKECVASKRRDVEFFLKTVPENSKLVFCTSVTVSEDTQCQCSCPKKSRKCLPRQKFDSNQCKCYCNNKKEEGECVRKRETHKWDQKKCACLCKSTRTCTTGSVWSHELCRCAKA